jgi:phosphoribosylanthranilate isomerase
MIVKVCGITNLEDAMAAVEFGATALGFNFWPSSPRYIAPAAASALLKNLHDRLGSAAFASVGILVGREGWHQVPTDILQLHGLDAPPDPRPNRRTWFATSPDCIDLFGDCEVIIDTSWGQGQLPDWEKISLIKRPYILSGGLTPDNVAAAIKRLTPAGVDVCSGVESRPGRKDFTKLKRFLGEVQRAIR